MMFLSFLPLTFAGTGKPLVLLSYPTIEISMVLVTYGFCAHASLQFSALLKPKLDARGNTQLGTGLLHVWAITSTCRGRSGFAVNVGSIRARAVATLENRGRRQVVCT